MTGLSDAAVRRLQRVADWPSPGERYEVIEPLGQGGMGKVYRARDRELERDVALKVLNVSRAGDDAARRMIREARILAGLEHPGIVPIHDVGRLPDGRVYYTMKLVRGARLDAFTREHPDLNVLLRVFERICDAVAFAHAHGVVHRDLKPGNVMVGAFGEVLVMDWGVAKILDGSDRDADAQPNRTAPTRPVVQVPAPPAAPSTGADTVSASAADTHPGTVLGTPGYMAPEQAEGRVAAVDQRTDVYALGMILRGFVDAAGGRPPRPLRALIERATAEDPARRYPRVAVLAEDVANFQAGLRVTAHRETAWERAGRVAYRFRTPILLILAYAAIRLLIFLLAGT